MFGLSKSQHVNSVIVGCERNNLFYISLFRFILRKKFPSLVLSFAIIFYQDACNPVIDGIQLYLEVHNTINKVLSGIDCQSLSNSPA